MAASLHEIANSDIVREVYINCSSGRSNLIRILSVRCKSCFGHLQHKTALLDEYLRTEERRRVVGEAIVVARLPPGEIQEVKVVSPVQIECPRLFIVSVDFNIVVHCVPWHVSVVEACVPLGEHRRPEVHHEGLRLCDQLHSWVELAIGTNLATIDGPSNEVWSPFHLVNVPV